MLALLILGMRQFDQALKDQRLRACLTWSTDVRWAFDTTRFQGGK